MLLGLGEEVREQTAANSIVTCCSFFLASLLLSNDNLFLEASAFCLESRLQR